MPWFLTPHGPHFVVEPGTIDEFERRDYVVMTAQQVTDYYAGVATPDPPSFATEAEVPGIVAGAVTAGTGPVAVALRAAFGSHARVSKTESLLRVGGGAPPSAKQTIVILGDSIVSQSAQQYNTATATMRVYTARGWVTHAQARMGHRFKVLRNAGISGENTAQVLARLQADVVNLAPGWCWIGGPTNSVTGIANGTRTLADEKAGLIAIWDALDAADIRIAQCTVTPWNQSSISPDPAARRNALFQVNQFLREQARTRPKLVLVDWYDELSSGVLSDWKAGYISASDTSGLHPNAQGAAEMGRIFAERIAPMSMPVPILPPSAAESANLVGSAALALGTTGTVGVGGTGQAATGWRVDPLPTASFTCSKVARTDGIPGEWQQVRVISGEVKIGVNVTGFGTVYNTGDEVYAIAEFETDDDLAVAVGNRTRLNLIAMKSDFGVGTQAIDFDVANVDDAGASAYFPRQGVMMTPLTVVPSTATLRLALQFERKGAGTVRVGRIGIYKKDTGPGADVWSRADAAAS